MAARMNQGRLGSGVVAGAFAALAAAAVFYVTAPYGPGASLDSVTYLSVARSLVAGQGWFRFDGLAYVDWPPLYPLTLAAGIGAGLEPIAAARALGAGAFALAVVGLVLTLARVTGSLAWAALGGLLAFASPAVLETYATAWSEGLFVTLTSVAFWLAARVGHEPRAREVVALALVASCAFLTRYLGVVLAAALGLWLLALPGPPAARLRRALLFAGVAAVGPAAWLLRNLMATGSAAGRRGEAVASLAHNLEQFGIGLARTLSVDGLGPVGSALAVAVVFGAAGLGLVVAWRARARPPAVPLVPALFLVLYGVALVVLATWTPVAPLRVTRFTMPLWLPFVLLVCALGASAWRRWPTAAARLALAVPLLLVGVHGAAQTLARAGDHRERGVYEFGRSNWHGSGLLDAVRSRDSGATVLTNVPHGVYLHTGVSVDYAPRRHDFRSRASQAESLEALRRRVAADGSVPFAWFILQGDESYYAPQELASQGFCLLGQEQHTDGIYFEIVDASRCPGARLVPPRDPRRGAAP